MRLFLSCTSNPANNMAAAVRITIKSNCTNALSMIIVIRAQKIRDKVVTRYSLPLEDMKLTHRTEFGANTKHQAFCLS